MAKIFSGNNSRKFWDAVNKAEKSPGILYEYGCKAQNMEAELIYLRKQAAGTEGRLLKELIQIRKEIRRELKKKK
jgi:hypothetical protein